MNHLHMGLASVIHSLAAVPGQQILECSLRQLCDLLLPTTKVCMLSACRFSAGFQLLW